MREHQTKIKFLTSKRWDFILETTLSFRGKNEGSYISYSPELIDLGFTHAKCPAQSLHKVLNECQSLPLLLSSPRSTQSEF